MTWWPERPAAVRIDSGWNWTAQRPAASSSIAMTAPSRVTAVTVKPPLTSGFLRVEGVVAGGGELRGQPGEQGAVVPAADLDPARLAVLRLGQQRQLAARVLDHRLQAEADAERGQLPRVELGQQLVALEVGRAAGAGREHDEVRGDLVEHDGGEPGAQGRDLRVVLAEVVRQGVHERVLVVHEQDAERPRPGRGPVLGSAPSG